MMKLRQHYTALFKQSHLLTASLLCALVFGLASCSQQKTKPDSSNGNSTNVPQNTKTIQNSLNSSELERYQKAITALNKNNPGNAKPLLIKLSKSQPELTAIWFNLALAHYQLNDLNDAESSLEQALTINPNDPQALVLKGVIETKKGNINQAEALYSKALSHKDDFANAHYNLALLYDIYYQDISLAVKHYQRYLELTDYSDKQTAVWFEELNNSLK